MTQGDHRENKSGQKQYKHIRWKAYKKTESGLPTYKTKHLEKLRRKLSTDRIVLAGEAGYNDDRMVFMHTYQQYPQVIVYCACDTDVLAALRFARKSNLQVAARSGGHCTAGYSVNDQLVIDTSAMDHVVVDAKKPRVRCGPGVMFRKLNRVLDYHKLHLPGGGCETVNVAGYMMGGGYGFTSRLYGMNCDRVVGVRLALPDGKIVTCNDKKHPDLFWAVRGGTGNQFGVLLEIIYEPVRLEHKFFGFGLRWNMRHKQKDDIDRVSRVLELLQAEYSNSEDAVPDMGHQALLMYLPDEKHPDGQIPCLSLRGLYRGTRSEALAALGPLINTLANFETDFEINEDKLHYTRLNEILLQTVHPPGEDMPNVSMNTKPLVEGWLINEHHSADRWRKVVEHFLDAPDKTCFIAMEFYGGEIAKRDPTEMAFVHRDPSIDLFSWAFWTFDTHKDKSIEWLDNLGVLASAMGSGRRYQNYPRRGTKNFLEAYFGQNLPRLKRIKQEVDPKNMFWFEQSLGDKPLPPDRHKTSDEKEVAAND